MAAVSVDRVPAKLEESVSVGIGVSTRNIRGPVSNGLGFITPNTRIISTNSRGIDVVAIVC